MVRPGAAEDLLRPPRCPIRVPTRLLRPVVLRLEYDDGLHHRVRRGIRCTFYPTRLAEDPFNFWKLPDEFVLYLQQAAGFRHRDAGQGGGHVEQRAFVERRHELRTQLEEDRD